MWKQTLFVVVIYRNSVNKVYFSCFILRNIVIALLVINGLLLSLKCSLKIEKFNSPQYIFWLCITFSFNLSSDICCEDLTSVLTKKNVQDYYFILTFSLGLIASCSNFEFIFFIKNMISK